MPSNLQKLTKDELIDMVMNLQKIHNNIAEKFNELLVLIKLCNDKEDLNLLLELKSYPIYEEDKQ